MVHFSGHWMEALEKVVSKDRHLDLSIGLFDHPHNMSASFPRAGVPRERESKEQVASLSRRGLKVTTITSAILFSLEVGHKVHVILKRRGIKNHCMKKGVFKEILNRLENHNIL